eukprot:scaffold83108_cov35-Tisochrysis_lutea.AAC.1
MSAGIRPSAPKHRSQLGACDLVREEFDTDRLWPHSGGVWDRVREYQVEVLFTVQVSVSERPIEWICCGPREGVVKDLAKHPDFRVGSEEIAESRAARARPG